MKKFLPAFLVLLTVLCGMLGFAACEEEPAAHTEHTFGEWATVKEATCAEEGLRERTCTECEFKDTEVIPVNSDAHKWDNGTITTSATCTTPGVKTFHCTRDNTHTKTEEVAVDQDAHEWDSGTITTPATCTTPGVKTFHCTRDNTHTKTESVAIDKDAHEWDNGTITTPATCKDPGVKTFHCIHDDAHTKTEAVAIDKDAHIWDEESSSSGQDGTHTLVCKIDPTHVREESCTYLDSVVQPTCDNAGYTEHVCIYCNYTKRDTPTDALGHSYTLIAPDPEHPGQHILTCANDPNHTKTESCQLTVQTIEPGCETQGYTVSNCAQCGYHAETDVKEAEGHEWGPWEQIEGSNNHIKHCTKDPNHTFTAACDFNTTVTKPTCTADGFTTYKCKDCPNTYTDDVITSPGHQYQIEQVPYGAKSVVRQHKQVCSVCSDSTLIDCVFTQTTLSGSSCDESGTIRHTCIACEQFYDESVEQLGHDWGNFVSDGKGHHTHTCQRANCHEQESFPCNLQVTDQHAATCTDDAYDVKVCTEPSCNYSVTEQHPGSKTGHDWTSEKAKVQQLDNKTHEITCGNGCGEKQTSACTIENGKVTAPTCTAKGYTTFTCPVCKAQYQDNETDMVAHQYGGWTPVDGYSAENKMHEHSCLSCHHKEQEACKGFTFRTTDATCAAEGQTLEVCDACNGETLFRTSPKLDHAFGGWVSNHNGTHYQECIHCKHKEQKPCELKTVSKNATCTEYGSIDEMCELCGYVKDGDDLPALGHNYGDAKWTYDNDNPGHHYRNCTVCGYKDSVACVVETETTNSTCKTGAVLKSTCSFCSHEDTQTVGTPLGCDYVYTDNGNGTHTRTCRRGDLCDDPTSKQENVSCTYDEVKTDATCTTDAYVTKTCTACQHSVVETSEKTATGHNFGTSYKNNRNGTHTRTCSKCKATEDENCTYDSEHLVEPTCTTEGYTTKTCSKCSNSINEDYTQTKPHTWGTEYKSSKNGKHHFTCTVCNTDSPDEVCVYNEVNHDATCTQAPYTTYTCQSCSYSYDQTTGEKLTHDWQVKTAATEESHSRKHTVYCTKCFEEKEELCIDDLEQTPATCDAPAHHKHTCTVCKSVYEHDEGTNLEHRYGAWTYNGAEKLTHTHRCTNCGHSETFECKKTNAKQVGGDCTTNAITQYTCSDCRGQFTETSETAKGHTWGYSEQVSGQKYHKVRCLVCGVVEQRDCVYNESGTDATCTQAGDKRLQCTICANIIRERTPALGHDWGDTEWNSENNGKHYRVCRRADCSERQEEACQMVPAGSAPTCLAPGKTGTICSKCLYSVGVTEQEALTHNLSPWKHTVIEGVNYHTRYCTRLGCDHVEQEACSVREERTTVTCTTPEQTTTTCDVCQFSETKVTQEAYGHAWVVESMNETQHKSKCQRCQTESETTHTFTTSNICDGCTFDGLTYELVGTEEAKKYYKVVGDNMVANAKKVIIPETFNNNQTDGTNYPVKVIVENAFIGNKALVELVLPRALESIGNYAFSNCTNLKTVKIAEGNADVALTTIGNSSFSFATALDTFPFRDLTKLISIGLDCFRGCQKLTDIYISDNVTQLGGDAFTDTGLYKNPSSWDDHALYLGKHLIKVYHTISGDFEVKETTLSIGETAFENCKLTKLTLHTNLKLIDNDAFKNATIETVEYTGTLAQWLAIKFGNDLSSPAHIAQYFHLTKAEGTPTIPTEGVNAIPAGMFYNNTTLQSIEIPGNITSIGAYAFYGCTALTSITIPDSVLYIGEHAFDGCSALLSNDENWVGGAFYLGNHLITSDNAKIKEAEGKVTIKSGTITISPHAFENCTELKEITIPQSVTWIGEMAFNGCSALKSATFEGAKADGTGTQYVAVNRGGAARNVGNLSDAALAAQNLTYWYTGFWRRTNPAFGAKVESETTSD